MSKSLYKLNEFGIQGRIDDKMFTRKPKCNGGSQFVPVSWVDVEPAFKVFGICFSLAILVFFIEIFLKKKNSSKSHKT